MPEVPSVLQSTLGHAPCQHENIRDAWTGFLNTWEWDLFGTFTFREEPRHAEVAQKLYRVFVSKVNRDLYGPRWYKKDLGISWTLAEERQQRGVLHFHTLWGQTGRLYDEPDRRFKAMEQWNELAGYARILPIESQAAVRAYVSKYVVKGGELTLGGQLHGHPALPLFDGIA